MLADVCLALLLFVCLLRLAEGHGRLVEPPSRGSMWRLGFGAPVNYDDNELSCGGFNVQWIRNDGRCGLCGDAWDGRRDHEIGGKMTTGRIVRRYVAGSAINVSVLLAAAHRGWFQFRLFPANRTHDPHPYDGNSSVLRQRGSDRERFHLRRPTHPGPDVYNLTLELPANVTCSRCVLQWKYHTGNSWGKDPDGRNCVGCGPQEEFYGCADVAISSAPHVRRRTDVGSGRETLVDGNRSQTGNLSGPRSQTGRLSGPRSQNGRLSGPRSQNGRLSGPRSQTGRLSGPPAQTGRSSGARSPVEADAVLPAKVPFDVPLGQLDDTSRADSFSLLIENDADAKRKRTVWSHVDNAPTTPIIKYRLQPVPAATVRFRNGTSSHRREMHKRSLHDNGGTKSETVTPHAPTKATMVVDAFRLLDDVNETTTLRRPENDESSNVLEQLNRILLPGGTLNETVLRKILGSFTSSENMKVGGRSDGDRKKGYRGNIKSKPQDGSVNSSSEDEALAVSPRRRLYFKDTGTRSTDRHDDGSGPIVTVVRREDGTRNRSVTPEPVTVGVLRPPPRDVGPTTAPTSSSTSSAQERNERDKILPKLAVCSEYRAGGEHARTPGMDDWCRMNCPSQQCRISHCACARPSTITSVCRPIRSFGDVPGYRWWCATRCSVRRPCPYRICACDSIADAPADGALVHAIGGDATTQIGGKMKAKNISEDEDERKKHTEKEEKISTKTRKKQGNQ